MSASDRLDRKRLSALQTASMEAPLQIRVCESHTHINGETFPTIDLRKAIDLWLASTTEGASDE